MCASIITARLAALRVEMRAAGVSAYIVSDADTAGSEIPAARFRKLAAKMSGVLLTKY
jgi:hypothetical protein